MHIKIQEPRLDTRPNPTHADGLKQDMPSLLLLDVKGEVLPAPEAM